VKRCSYIINKFGPSIAFISLKSNQTNGIRQPQAEGKGDNRKISRYILNILKKKVPGIPSITNAIQGFLHQVTILYIA